MSVISHTGGTTGEPKGVMCSDYNINALIWQVGHILPHKRQEVMLVVLPPFINYSLVNAMLEGLAFGCQVVLIPDYKPEKFLYYVKKYQPNHINSIPAYWEVLLHEPRMKEKELACLDHIVYGGEAMDEEKEKRLNEILLSHGARRKIAKGLGSTEMVSAATIAFEETNVAGSAGVPLVRVDCKIVDAGTKEELSYGEEGEVCFGGPTVMLGYYKREEDTEDVIQIHSDGLRWLHTGDLGYMDENGILFVTGRIKRIFMTKGKDKQVTKIFPDRIEKVIDTHPSVELSCVVGVQDVERIHYPKAFVVLKEHEKRAFVITEEILELCRKNLPEYMVPDKIEFREELPRTERGKVDYRKLEEIR